MLSTINTIEKNVRNFIFNRSNQLYQNYKIVDLEHSGRVILKKSSRAKYLGIRIKPFDGVVVTVPKRVSYLEAEVFARSKDGWIFKHLSKIKKIESNQIVFDENTSYKTKEHKLVIRKSDVDKTYIKIENSEIIVEYPSTQDVSSENIQAEIKLGIIEALRLEAKKYIPRRVEELAYLFGFKYNKLLLKNLKSRWGSCSERNNINLNIHLMRLPDELIDYVILHELTHIKHKNHSKNFWNALENILPDSKKIDRKFRNYTPLRF